MSVLAVIEIVNTERLGELLVGLAFNMVAIAVGRIATMVRHITP